MNTETNRRTTALFATLMLTVWVPLVGQTAPPSGAPPAAADEVHTLSPFVVQADSSVGYIATQTVSGTRLRSELKDIGASVDVLTTEFLRDVGAVDLYSALEHVGNISTWQESGNISETENALWYGTPYMSRGFEASTQMLDFFSRGRGVTIDLYNTENFSVVRGPNAVLYGIGSPGGIVSVTRNRPSFGRDRYSATVRADRNDSMRLSLDLNHRLIKDKLAVRLNVLDDDNKEWISPAGRKREGWYGAVTYRPFAKTSLTATFEDNSIKDVFRYSTLPYDGISAWQAAGSPIVSEYRSNGANINQAPGSGLDREGRRLFFVVGQALPILNWQNTARGEQPEIQGHPDIADIRRTSFNETNTPYELYDRQLAGEARRRGLDHDDITIFLEQEITPNLFVELAYNRQNFDDLFVQAIPYGWVSVDVNQQLPNAQPNPNFMSPYMDFERIEGSSTLTDEETWRATVSYKLDLNDHKIGSIGFGRYNLAALYEEFDGHDFYAGFRLQNITPLAGFPTVLNHNDNRIRPRVYLDKTSATPAGARGVFDYYFDDYANMAGAEITPAFVRHNSPRNLTDTRETFAFALQAFFWKSQAGYDRIVATYGYREDKMSTRNYSYNVVNGIFQGENWFTNPWAMSADDRRKLWDGTLNYGTPQPVSKEKANPSSYSLMFRPLANVTLYYNYSDVLIQSSALNTDIYGNDPPSTEGTTDDFGIRVGLLDDRISASLTFFSTSANDQNTTIGRNDIPNWVEEIWQVVDPNSPYANVGERFVTLRTDKSEGLEFQLTANLKPNWRTRMTISQQDTTVDSVLSTVDRYIAEFLPRWEQHRNSALPLAEQTSSKITVGDSINELTRWVANEHKKESTVPQAQREWKVNFTTNYDFRAGFLKNWGIGGGLRWQSSDIIGYALDSEQLVDAARPFKGEELFTVDASMSYRTRLWRDKLNLRIQLNVRNLLNNEGPFPRQAYDDLTGQPFYTRYQLKVPRTYYLTTTVHF